MGMKIWELHSLQLDGTIRSTPEGEADVAGLVFSEKAYLLAVRDFRPAEIVKLVNDQGPIVAARTIEAHYREIVTLNASGGRALVAGRSHGPEPMLRRSDEVHSPLLDQALFSATR